MTYYVLLRSGELRARYLRPKSGAYVIETVADGDGVEHYIHTLTLIDNRGVRRECRVVDVYHRHPVQLAQMLPRVITEMLRRRPLAPMF